MQESDRRRYFRINDWVGLSYRVAGNRLQQDALTEADNVQIPSAQLLETINRELLSALNLLWKNNPAVANVIGLLNRKIDFLVSEMDLDYLDCSVKHEVTQVNISACGIAFESAEAFEVGQMLELHLMLKPTNIRLKINGSVCACEPVPSDTQKVNFLRIDFANIDTHIQEELIQHIVRRQSLLLNEQRHA